MRKRQYQIGITSLLIYALGMVPFKDTFWTSRIQPGNKYSMLTSLSVSFLYLFLSLTFVVVVIVITLSSTIVFCCSRYFCNIFSVFNIYIYIYSFIIGDQH